MTSKLINVPWERVGTAIYATNQSGANAFYADVQPGFIGNPQTRTPEADLEAVAILMQKAPKLLQMLQRIYDEWQGDDDGILYTDTIDDIESLLRDVKGGGA